jgi:hypothetical protein
MPLLTDSFHVSVNSRTEESSERQAGTKKTWLSSIPQETQSPCRMEAARQRYAARSD